MNQQSGRRGSIRLNDPLESLIRQALEERIAGNTPPEYGRQVLLARAREAARLERHTPRRWFDRLQWRHSTVPVSSVMWNYDPHTGRYRRDSHLSLAINTFTNPLLNLMR